MTAVFVKNAERMMTKAEPQLEGIQIWFADGRSGLLPYSALPEIAGRSSLAAIGFPNAYELMLETERGERVEIPWDFARHYCDESYRANIECIAAKGRKVLGSRIRRFREAQKVTQEALALSARIDRVTLADVESGQESPRFEVLSAIAQALGKSMADLAAPRDVMKAWVVRCIGGEDEDMSDQFWNMGVAAIGWHEVGDLSQFVNQRHVRDRIQAVYSENNRRAGAHASTLYRFANEVGAGHTILTPPPNRPILIGRCVGPYSFQCERQGIFELHPNTVPVEWVKTVPRSTLSKELSRSLGRQTLVDVSHHMSEILDITGQAAD